MADITPADYIDPYSQNEPDKPVADQIVHLKQGDTTELFRQVRNPDGTAATPDTCILEFTVVNDRFEREPIFKADWHDNILIANEPMATVKIRIPRTVTETWMRGSLLYSLTWWDKLRDVRKTLEEGNLVIEYAADAPDPEIPYNPSNDAEDQTNYGAG